ncbi:MAG: hypothetical protein MI919_39105, partial [Holophagales bacterium]|nr:hypothetical protein [Holophagales bacterium]
MKDPLRIPRFLMEAWQGLVGLEEAVEGLRGSEPEVARQALIALASRLEASTSEYGFGRLGHLAGSLVRLAR